MFGMDIEGMIIFARVVEAGSFSRAAQRLEVSKSVVNYSPSTAT